MVYKKCGEMTKKFKKNVKGGYCKRDFPITKGAYLRVLVVMLGSEIGTPFYPKHALCITHA